MVAESRGRCKLTPFMKRLLIASLVALLAPAGLESQSSPAGPVTSRDGLVVSSSDIASDIGAGVLARGGNAVDAAVATGFALAVTYPGAGNLGGGGFMIVRTPGGKSTAIDYREKAPAQIDADDVLWAAMAPSFLH